MLDVQSQSPKRRIGIDQVGISDFLIPIKMKGKDKEHINTNALFSFSGSLEKTERGTHMSRFISILHEYQKEIFDYQKLVEISDVAKNKLNTSCSLLSLEFDYFITKNSPVTKHEGMINCKAGFKIKNNCKKEVFLDVEVPVTSVCPCSREISDFGAHNQRGIVKIIVDISDRTDIWIDDLVKIAENASSFELYSILKREDEKYVTERAYQNAAFVEDIAREAAGSLNKLKIKNYIINCKNMESIHNHNAFATIKKGEICI